MHGTGAKSNRGGTLAAQQERAQETRGKLVSSAHALFAELGFVAVGINEIVAAAGLTRGAFYHHFTSKTALFEAVFRDAAEALNNEAKFKAAEQSSDRWDRIVGAYRSYLDLVASNTAYQRILLVDGPAVLGWKRWREFHADYVARRTEDALRLLIDEGAVVDRPVTPLANLIQAALNDAALTIAESDNPAAAATESADAFIFLLERIRVILPHRDAKNG